MEEEKGAEDAEDNASFVKDVVASSGKILNPKPRAILGNPRNPNVMLILSYRGKGFEVVCYTPKGASPMEYNITQQKELENVCNLITSAPSGTSWRVLCYELPTPKKTQNQGKGFARRFTKLSNAEGEETKWPSKEVPEKQIQAKKGCGKKTAANEKT